MIAFANLKKVPNVLQNECVSLIEEDKILIHNPKMYWDLSSEKTFIFKVKGFRGEVAIYSETKELYGEFKMEGRSFQFFVAKCNEGDFEYNILPFSLN